MLNRKVLNRKVLMTVGVAMATGAALVGCSSDSGSDSQATPTVNETPLASQTQEKFQQILDEARTTFDFPGAQAGVWTPDGAWIGVTGTSAQGGDRPPTRDDHTRIGSLTKTFTVAVLLQQADKGLVSLDDPIGKYIDGMPNGNKATLRQLASMTSGIPSYTFDDEFLTEFSADPRSSFTPEQLIGYVKGDKPLFKPGTEVNYSNTNTVLLGMVIEQVTGAPFEESLQTGLLTPLNLTSTSWPGDSTELPDPYLSGVTTQGDPEGVIKDATNWNPSWGFTAGEMISALDDMRIWAVALGTGEGWASPAAQQEREASKTSTAKGNSAERAYALGFGTEGTWLGHAGNLPGYSSDLQYDSATGNTIVVMVNSDVRNDNNSLTANEPAPYIFEKLREALSNS